MTLAGLKLRIFAYRTVFKRFHRKIALMGAGVFMLVSILEILDIFYPGFIKYSGRQPHPVGDAVMAVVCLVVYFLLGRIRG